MMEGVDAAATIIEVLVGAGVCVGQARLIEPRHTDISGEGLVGDDHQADRLRNADLHKGIGVPTARHGSALHISHKFVKCYNFEACCLSGMLMLTQLTSHNQGKCSSRQMGCSGMTGQHGQPACAAAMLRNG